MNEDQKDFDFYKNFYEKNGIRIRHYESLRKHFNQMVEDVLSPNYYNMGEDVYEADRITCEDITRKIKNKSIWQKIFGGK